MSEQQERRPLAAPLVERKHFGRNFISQAVCEVRFPTLFELDSEKPPADLAHALRKEFPIHERQANVKVTFSPGVVGQSNAHVFRSRKSQWTFTLRTSSFSLETTNYYSFEEFKSKLGLILSATSKVVDTDFFTRIGLRYINSVPCDVNNVAGWINQSLCAPLASGIYGDPSEHWQRIVGTTNADGGYIFQHGIGRNEKTGAKLYILDYDFFVEDVQAVDAMGVVNELHLLEHNLFRWSIGPVAQEFLGLKE